MHEQDVRRAVGRPAAWTPRPPEHTADYLAESLGYVLAKRVGATAGTTVVLEIGGQRAVRVRGQRDGRGERLADVPADPTVRAADGPRVVHRARRRPARRRSPARSRVDRRRGARPADPRRAWRPPRDDEARTLVPRRHPGPGRAARSWSPARPSAASATTPRSSWPAAAAGSSWPAGPRSSSTRPSTPSAGRSRAPTLEHLAVDLADLAVGAPGGGPGRGRSGRSTCWSTTPA